MEYNPEEMRIVGKRYSEELAKALNYLPNDLDTIMASIKGKSRLTTLEEEID